MNLRAIRNTLNIAKELAKEFPDGCKTGSELDWLPKGICPFCAANPIERLSNYEYSRKYPVEHTMQFGIARIDMCSHHFNEFMKYLERVKEAHTRTTES